MAVMRVGLGVVLGVRVRVSNYNINIFILAPENMGRMK